MNESKWKGSIATASKVAAQIAERWGEDEVKNYDPEKNCFTYKRWEAEGYQVQKGEKAIKSFSFRESEDGSKYPVKVNLFYIKQVKKI